VVDVLPNGEFVSLDRKHWQELHGKYVLASGYIYAGTRLAGSEVRLFVEKN
jgi:hypothetical protein